MSHVTAEALHDTALSPVLFAEGEDRRHSARVPLARPVKVGPAGGFPEALVSARDLSHEGMFVDADRPVRVGARFCVQIDFGEGELAYVAEAEVAYNREHVHGSGFGVRFVDVDEEARAKIDAEISRQTDVLLGGPTLVPSILHAVPDIASDAPTLAPSPSQMMIPTDEVRRVPRTKAEAMSMPSLPNEPDFNSELELMDLPTPEAVDESSKKEKMQAMLQRSSATLARTGPGILVLAGLGLMLSFGLAMWWDGARQEAAPTAPTAKQAEVAAAEAKGPAPKKPLPPLVLEDELEPAHAQAPALPTMAAEPKAEAKTAPVAEPKAEAKAAPVAEAKAAPVAEAKAAPVAEAKAAPVAPAEKANELSAAAQALLGEAAPRLGLKVDAGAKVLKTHVFHNPERFVLDIVGQGSALALPLASGAVKAVRSGRHTDFTRVVFDIDGELEAGRAELQDDTITVQLHLR